MILNLSKKCKVHKDQHLNNGYKLIMKLNEIAPLYIQVTEKSKYPLITVEPFDCAEAFIVRATNEINDLTTFIAYDENVFDNIRDFCKQWNKCLEVVHCL